MIKKFVLLFLLFLSIPVSFAKGQACGKSVRTISLKFPAKAKTPVRVGYQLFYLAPKNTGADYNDYERTGNFLSEFLYEKPKAEKWKFWFGTEAENPFIIVSKEKAENYIKSYKLTDFKDFYTNKWYDNHLSQLKGKFTNGVLKLETRETDVTPFIMRITAPKFETLYLLSSFLGGCFNNQPEQTVEMKSIKK